MIDLNQAPRQNYGPWTSTPSPAPTTESILAEVRVKLESAGLAPAHIIMDGTLQRCPVQAKPNGRDGAYIVHADSPPSAWWQNHVTGDTGTWTARSNGSLSQAERETLRQRMERDKAAREKAQAERHTQAAAKAKEIWDQAKAADPAHPYLVAKGIKPVGDIRQKGDSLVVPVLDSQGEIISLQFISPSKNPKTSRDKDFLGGGKVAGGHFTLPGDDGPLLIAEGYATAASLREATGFAVMVAFTANNLLAVARMARERYPEREIIVCADNDLNTPGNPGVKAATEAAKAINGKVAVPVLPDGGKADFNDLHQTAGAEEVVKQVQAAMAGPSMPQDSEPDAWTLARDTFPRTPFPWGVLPEELARSLKILARSCAGSPNPLPGTVFCLMGAAMGRTIEVMAKSSWTEPLIFWAMDIRESGDGKTSPMNLLAGPLRDRQKAEYERFERAMADWKALTKKERAEIQPPAGARGYVGHDVTLEGVHTDLADHPTGGLAIILNEASTLLTAQGQYKGGKGSDREGWLVLWDGSTLRIVRAGKDLFIKGSRVSVCGGIQPQTFRKIFSADDGLYLQDGTVFRGLFTFEPSTSYELTRESWGREPREVWERTITRALDWADRQAGQVPRQLRPEGQALDFLIDWRNDRDSLKRDMPEHLRGFAPKSVSYALRLAGVLHCLKAFHQGNEPGGQISESAMKDGIAVAEFYMGQAVDAVRILSDADAPAPVEVSERTFILAEALESLRPDLDNGRLAVGFIQERFNLLAAKEMQISAPKVMGALLRGAGLTVSESLHNANGRQRARCLEWNRKVDEFLHQGETNESTKNCSLAPETRMDKGERDNGDKRDVNFSSHFFSHSDEKSQDTTEPRLGCLHCLKTEEQQGMAGRENENSCSPLSRPEPDDDEFPDFSEVEL